MIFGLISSPLMKRWQSKFDSLWKTTGISLGQYISNYIYCVQHLYLVLNFYIKIDWFVYTNVSFLYIKMLRDLSAKYCLKKKTSKKGS